MGKMKKPKQNTDIIPNQVYQNKEIYQGNNLAVANYKQSRGPIRDKISPYDAPTSSGDIIKQVAKQNSKNTATTQYENSFIPGHAKVTKDELNATVMNGFRIYPSTESGTDIRPKIKPQIKKAEKGIKSYYAGTSAVDDPGIVQQEIGRPIKRPTMQNQGNLELQQQIAQNKINYSNQLTQSAIDSFSQAASTLSSGKSSGNILSGVMKKSPKNFNGGNNMTGESAPAGIQATAADGIKNFRPPKYLDNYQAVSTNPIPDYVYGNKSLKGYRNGTRVLKYPKGSKSIKSTKNWTPEVKIMDNPYPKETQEPEKYSKKEQLEGDAIAKVLMGRNKGKNFVDRAFNSQNYPSRQTNTIPGFEAVNPNEYSTHLMATGESRNGKTPIYPTLEYNKSTDKLDDVWGKEPKEYIEAPDMYAKYIGELGYKTATGLGIRPNDARQSLSGFEKTKSIPMEKNGSKSIKLKQTKIKK